jgi:ribonuclease VapC
VTHDRPSPIDLVIDSSALIAVTLDERSAGEVRNALAAAAGPVISAATLVETSIVAAARLGPSGPVATRTLLDAARVVTMPVDEHQAELAAGAWQRFGRGRHRARLNYGDCFSYALAAHLDVPLLCIGDDFRHTDLQLVDVTA